ncbi:MAG: hypothetical protein DVB31_13855 [Verrucomicrobia bacterium]|nr:MAG: hypothetical protein DVB31_13855 [Verrucomicrobiota bacterium]
MAGALLLGAPHASAAPAFLGYSAGDPTSTAVTLWTRAVDAGAPAEIPLVAQVSTDPTLASGVTGYPVQTVAGNDYTAKVRVTGLQPATRYYYAFTDGVVTNGVGTFRTAPAPDAAAAVRFAFSGDNDGLMRPYALASTLPAQGLDFYINLGDTMYENASNVKGNVGESYTNSPSVTLSGTLPGPTSTGATRAQLFGDYARKYRENFLPVNAGGQPGLQPMYSGQAVYSLYDNHELGNRQYINGGAPAGGAVGDMDSGAGVDARVAANDVNGSGTFINRTPGFLTLQQVYLSYQPIADRGVVAAPSDPRTDGTKQLYFAERWGKNVVFVNVDDRSYRDIRVKTADNKDDTSAPRANNPGRTILGATQLAWLKQTLLEAQHSGVVWKFVAVSDPIDQIGPIGGSLSGIANSSGNNAYSPVGSDGGKSWIGGYRAERNGLLKFIADNGIQNVVFMATDDHQNRINELTYSPSGQTEDQSTYAKVPSCFSIVAGPLGATGPDLFANHDFASIKTMADSFVAAQQSAHVEPFGLQGYPGLTNVVRENDPNAGTSPSAVDFYSPDTFNYVTLEVAADGTTLTVGTHGITATSQNGALEYDAVGNPVRRILGFQVAAAAPVVVAQPQAIVAARQGDTVELSAVVSGATSYQWYKDGIAVRGANGPSLTLGNVQGNAGPNQIGPSTVTAPVLDALVPGVAFQALFSAGESVNKKADGVTPYRMVGIPDGLGAFDNGDGTFTLLMNHELNAASGIPRAHGGKGAFVSRWVISKSDLAVQSINDLMKTVYLWDPVLGTYSVAPAATFSRFCSSDLPAVAAYYNAASGLGTTNRIFMNGEEGNKESRALAHVVTGPEAGNSYELPYLGRIAWENALANPVPQDKTIVACDDDSSVNNSRVNFYVGTKRASGLDIEKAGLSGGILYGIKLAGFTNETDLAVPANGTAFSLFAYGQVAGVSGAQIEAQAVANGVASFQRVEDGAWDPNRPSDYYFVTTASFGGKSRLWRLRFADVANPENGGSIDLLLNGGEGQHMFDNIGFDANGDLVLLEDPGNNAYVARVWKYLPATGTSFPIATFRPSLFTPGAPGFLTQDEESSGVVDVSAILGYRAMLLVAQIHTTNGIPAGADTNEIVENGQLLLLRQVDAGAYTLVAGNASGSIATEVANLSVQVPPTIGAAAFHAGLPGATAGTGGTLTLAVPPVAVSGTLPVAYQWFLDGKSLEGQTGPTLTVVGFGQGNAGNYTVRVSNAAGGVASAPVPVGLADIAYFGGITLDAPAGAKFRLEYLPDISKSATWITWSNVVHQGGRQFYIDTSSPGSPRRFFRAVPTP